MGFCNFNVNNFWDNDFISYYSVGRKQHNKVCGSKNTTKETCMFSIYGACWLASSFLALGTWPKGTVFIEEISKTLDVVSSNLFWDPTAPKNEQIQISNKSACYLYYLHWLRGSHTLPYPYLSGLMFGYAWYFAPKNVSSIVIAPLFCLNVSIFLI